MHHRTPLMVLALSALLLACGDEDGDYSKKDTRDGGGRPRTTVGDQQPGKPGGEGPDEDAGEGSEPDDLDAGGPAELDASSGAPDGGAPRTDAGGSGGDARADAEPPGSDGGGVCAEPGESCETDDCCAGATCIIEPETGDAICAAECSAPSECNSGCCLSVRDSDVGACGPARYCEAPPVPTDTDCGALVLIAEDGTYLGDAVSNPVAPDGVCNRVGVHGSGVGPQSIFNSVGLYGSTVGPQSAYNSLTSTPPALLCDESGEIVAFVTKNQLLLGTVIDPDALCAVLTNAGF